MDDDQDKLLEEASQVVRQQAAEMVRALDSSNMREALKHSSNMLCELRTSNLSPRSYYELYMKVFDELRHLETFFMEEYRKGRKMADLYEKVQHAGNIVPRLYLLITVGSVYIQTKEQPAKDILKDLIEMVKGVQQPMRGLFLRYYLNKCCKDKLPDVGNEYHGVGGDSTDSIEFLLTNLSEMNRLWIRMQHTGSVKDKTKREKERNDLRVTVGENLVRLSSLQGVTLDIYKSVVLPRTLEIVTVSKDVISQQYLMDCIIQAFPDDYHLNTLEPLLEACTQLMPAVDIKGILINLMDRLSNYAGERQGDIDILKKLDVFALFKRYIDKIISDQQGSMDVRKLLELEVAFLRFSLKCYPLNSDYVNCIYESCLLMIEKTEGVVLDPESLKNIVQLLTVPLETLSLAILSMRHYPLLQAYLPFVFRKQVAHRIVQAVISTKTPLNTIENCERLLDYVKPLLVDSKDSQQGEDYEFEDEQEAVAKMVHLIGAEEIDVHYQILQMFEKLFRQGGPRRVLHTYPSLIFCYIRFCRKLMTISHSLDLEIIFKACLEFVDTVSELNPQLGLRLNLQIAQCINLVDREKDHEEMAYEFASQALLLYQDKLQPETRYSALMLITGTYVWLSCFEEENYETLAFNCAQYYLKLGKKSDQFAAQMAALRLFRNHTTDNEAKIRNIFTKAQRIANSAKDPSLYPALFSHYIYCLDKAFPGVDDSNAAGLLELVRSKLAEAEKTGQLTSEARIHLNSTVDYVRQQKTQGKFQGVTV
jgi:vacuolar protein sorting-associated protein 35